ncbi:hypothetical protein [Zwartia vadi]|uniref:hypothetical protein n=1 Tax=Zwartia vadi TaxID=3058168 RepID=UPI0025B62684|nr:hypothetical protein [Zwartia vadi]MDN3988407.1 hypothetical protein [Zwartia vadi]
MPCSLSSSAQSEACVVSYSEGTDLVFALDWTPLVGGLPEKLGRQRARAAGATHFVVMGSLAAVVGYGVIRYQSSGDGERRSESVRAAYAAAALFALAHPEGVIAAIWSVPEKGYWFVAVNSGLVLAQTDRWYSTLVEAEAALLGLKERFPAMRVLHTEYLGEDGVSDWILKRINPQARLEKMTRQNSRFIQLVCLSFVITICGWLWLDRPSHQALPLPEDHADERWQQVLQDFSNKHPVHHADQLFKVVAAWHQAPLSPGGWTLKQVLCEPLGMDWHCAARYQRMKKLAMSEQLDAAKPEGWIAEFSDFDHGILRWSVTDAASIFEPVPQTVPFKTWLSYLQSVAPVFQSIQIGSGSPVLLHAPLSQMGVALARPSSIKPLKRRMLAIKGPLRSLSALKGLTIPVRWRSVQLDLGMPEGQGVSRSELIVSLNGEVFEISE